MGYEPGAGDLKQTGRAAKPLPAYEVVAAKLRAQIIDGSIPPGAWLRHVQLAESFGLSIQPVRQALQQLQGEGLIENLPNRGGRVRGIDHRRIVHIFEIREALESHLSRRFAEEAPLSRIRRLQEIQGRHDAAVDACDAELVSKINAEFHEVIHSLGDNAEAFELVNRYLTLAQQLRQRFPGNEERWKAARDDHHNLIQHFLKRDAAAAGDLGARHVRGGLEGLLNSMKKAGQSEP